MSERKASIAAWLLVCCALVFAIVVLGGVTRLTRSGLSITEWQPIAGIIPPLTDTQWEEALAKYRQTPEYQKVNVGMTIAEFKGIFWLEYFHRLLGRVIGFAFLIPFLYFLARRRFDTKLALKLGGVFVLGALQGVLGWYMVASGLVDEPRVSQHRLTAHLTLAFIIYAAMLWIALGLLFPRSTAAAGGGTGALRGLAWAVTALVGMMVLTGGFVAGIRAGYAYNTFPLMNGHLIPPELFMLEPWHQNFFFNMATVQFNHRLFAWALALLVPVFWVKTMRSEAPARVKLLAHLLLAALAAQIALGIATLLLAVPIALGAAHQGGALVVFTFALLLNHALRAGSGRWPESPGYLRS
ncbi:MAG: heme A synthase [Betaproteobacteria bacterium]|nr:heme A synthase [Betaproteobacteria bacterium]